MRLLRVLAGLVLVACIVTPASALAETNGWSTIGEPPFSLDHVTLNRDQLGRDVFIGWNDWDPGNVARSLDGGGTWSTICPVGLAVTDMASSDASTVILLSADEGCFVSSDGGSTFDETLSAATEKDSFHGVTADGQNGLITGFFNWYTTTDAGQTWQTISPRFGWEYQLRLLPSFAADHTLVAVFGQDLGWPSQLARSSDCGLTWNTAPMSGIPSDASLCEVDLTPTFATDHVVLAIAAANVMHAEIFRSTDGGQTFVKVLASPDDNSHVPSPDYQNGAFTFSPDFANDHTVFVMKNGLAYRSLDAGLTWRPFGAWSRTIGSQVMPSPDYASTKKVYAANDGELVSYVFGAPTKLRWGRPTVHVATFSYGKYIDFTCSSAPGHPDQTPATVRLYRKRGTRWSLYKSIKGSIFFGDGSAGAMVKWMSVPIGTYRACFVHACPIHVSTTSAYVYFTRGSRSLTKVHH